MSQPPPYPPALPYPPVAWPPYGFPTLPPAARRAGLLLLILGPLIVLLGGCMAGMSHFILRMERRPELAQLRQQVAQSGQTIRQICGQLLVLGVVAISLGLALLVLGVFVRRGRRWAIVTSLVAVGLITAWSALMLVLAISQMGQPQGLANACFVVVVTALSLLQLVWLVAAVRERPAAGFDAAYQQYAAQWYYYQQAAQPYGLGYGFTTPASPELPGQAESPPSRPTPPNT